MAAIGPQATLNATAGGDVALVQVAQADDAQGATQTLALNVGRIEARNVWLAARSSAAGVGGDIHVAAGSALSAVGVASLLAGNNLSPRVQWSARRPDLGRTAHEPARGPR